MTKEEEIKICSICQREYGGWGNNARPINKGRCCDECDNLVIVARLNVIKGRHSKIINLKQKIWK